MKRTLVVTVFALASLLLDLQGALVRCENATKTPEKSTPNFLQVEKEVVEVTMPPDELSRTQTNETIQVFSESGSGSRSGEARSNVKPRKGVVFDTPSSSPVTNTSAYSVQEKLDEPHPVAPIIIDTSTNASSTTPKPVEGAKGEVTAVETEAKKPEITFSPYDNPEILKNAVEPHKVPETGHVQSVEEPTSAMSKEFDVEEDVPGFGSYLSYVVISAIVLVFIALPIVFGRKLKDYWATRHYRRVDFLVDGMYND